MAIMMQTFEENHKDEIALLEKELKTANIDNITISKIISSGYFMSKVSPDVIYDSFYGQEWLMAGTFHKSHFIDLINKSENEHKFHPEVYYISNIDDIYTILSKTDKDRFYLKNGFLSFRGQTKEYKTKRHFPNPIMSDNTGEETLIIPSIWRKYASDFNKRTINAEFANIFTMQFGDEIIYHGIKKWKKLAEINYKRYGMHTLCDWEDFPDEDSKEYFRRWKNFKIQGNCNPHLSLVLQHYGIDTNGLDVTFDPKVAGFFASNKYIQKDNGKATYEPMEKGNYKGVIYCFYFRAPTLVETKDKIVNIPIFDHLKPLRPIKQSCALPFFHYLNFNEAYKHVYKIFYLNEDFDTTNLPNKKEIFPSINEDLFYNALMDLKPHNEYFKCFNEFEFD